MADTKTDEKQFNDTLKRMLKTPPKPHEKPDASEQYDKRKPGGPPVKKDHPEAQ